MRWSLLSNALKPFWNLLCSPNLDTRTWICRLNFAQRPIFSGLRFFNEPESQTRDPQLKVLPGGLVIKIFTFWKNPSTSVGFESTNLGSRGEHVTPTTEAYKSAHTPATQMTTRRWDIMLLQTIHRRRKQTSRGDSILTDAPHKTR